MTQETWPYPTQTLELLTQSQNMIALYDPEERLRAANPAYRAAYHCSPSDTPLWHDMMRQNYLHQRGPVIKTDCIDTWLTAARARRASMPHRAFEVELHDGRWILITETLSSNGWMLFHAADITNVRRSSRELRMRLDDARRASWTDPLTGVPNRRYLLDRAEEWHAHQRTQLPYGSHAIAVIDLDNFKELNDRHGHAVGDTVLIAFCREVVESIRSVDLFGRLGGEEFILLMPNCPLPVAKQRLTRLQKQIGEQKTGTKLAPVQYSFSAGLTLIRQDKDIHHAIRRADKLLFQAKAEGRNRVICDMAIA